MSATAMDWSRNKAPEDSLFQLFLTRDYCVPDTEWHQREGGKPHDTVKPIAAHGLDLTRTILIDDSLRKVLAAERGNSLELPTLLRSTVSSPRRSCPLCSFLVLFRVSSVDQVYSCKESQWHTLLECLWECTEGFHLLTGILAHAYMISEQPFTFNRLMGKCSIIKRPVPCAGSHARAGDRERR